jgi:hypothetical protein
MTIRNFLCETFAFPRTIFFCGEECGCEYRDDQHVLPLYVQIAYLLENFDEKDLECEQLVRDRMKLHFDELEKFLGAMRVGDTTIELHLHWKKILELMKKARIFQRSNEQSLCLTRMSDVEWLGSVGSVDQASSDYSEKKRGFRFDRDRFVILGTHFRVGYMSAKVNYTDDKFTARPVFENQTYVAVREMRELSKSAKCTAIILAQMYDLISHFTAVQPGFDKMLARKYAGDIWLQNDIFAYGYESVHGVVSSRAWIELGSHKAHFLPSCAFLNKLDTAKFVERWLMVVCGAQLCNLYFEESVVLRDIESRQVLPDYDASCDICLDLPHNSCSTRCVSPEAHLLIEYLYQGTLPSLPVALNLSNNIYSTKTVDCHGKSIMPSLFVDIENNKSLLQYYRHVSSSTPEFSEQGALFRRDSDMFEQFLEVYGRDVNYRFMGEPGFGLAVTHEIIESIFQAYMLHGNAILSLSSASVENVVELRLLDDCRPCRVCEERGRSSVDCKNMCQGEKALDGFAYLVIHVVRTMRPMSFHLGAMLVMSCFSHEFCPYDLLSSMLFYDKNLSCRYITCDTSEKFSVDILTIRYEKVYELMRRGRIRRVPTSPAPMRLGLQLLYLNYANGGNFGDMVSTSGGSFTKLECQVALISMLSIPVLLSAPGQLFDLAQYIHIQMASTPKLETCTYGVSLRPSERSQLLADRVSRMYRDKLRERDTDNVHVHLAKNLVVFASVASAMRMLVQFMAFVKEIADEQNMHYVYYALTAQRGIPFRVLKEARRYIAECGVREETLWEPLKVSLELMQEDYFGDAWNPSAFLPFLVQNQWRDICEKISVRKDMLIRLQINSVHEGPWSDIDFRYPTVSTCVRTVYLSPAHSYAKFREGMIELCTAAKRFDTY